MGTHHQVHRMDNQSFFWGGDIAAATLEEHLGLKLPGHHFHCNTDSSKGPFTKIYVSDPLQTERHHQLVAKITLLGSGNAQTKL